MIFDTSVFQVKNDKKYLKNTINDFLYEVWHVWDNDTADLEDYLMTCASLIIPSWTSSDIIEDGNYVKKNRKKTTSSFSCSKLKNVSYAEYFIKE